MSLLQLAVGIGLVLALVAGINRNTNRVTLALAAPAVVEPGALYRRIDGAGSEQFMACSPATNPVLAVLLQTGRAETPLAATGQLARVTGAGPDALCYAAYTTQRHGLRQLRDSFLRAARHPGWVGGGMMIYFLCLVSVTLRWQVLLAAQGLPMPFPRALALYFIGQFFSSFLPGAVSGDFIKMYYVTRECPDKKTEAATTVFVDRILGLLALIFLCVSVMLCKLPFFLADARTRLALLFNVALLGGTTMGLLLVFKRSFFEQHAWFRRLEQHSRMGDVITRAYEAFRQCLSSPTVLVKTIAWSLLNHLALVTGSWAICQGLALPMTFIDCLTVFPIINAIAAIPVTPGGLGTRDSAAVFLLGIFGVSHSDALTISLLIYSMILLWSLIGGIVYLLFPARKAGTATP